MLLLSGGHGIAQSWGNVKAQIIWGDETIPARESINVNKDQMHCLNHGPLLSDKLLIDPKSKGIKNVLVWLKSADDTPLSIHPNVKAVPAAAVEIDQPQCQFVPRVVAFREGQALVIKNSSPVAHSAQITGRLNAGMNVVIQPGGVLRLAGNQQLKAESKPLNLGCAFHGWMGGLIGVFDHPYFAISNESGEFEIQNAPAGDCLVFMFHEQFGWLHPGHTSRGHPIKVPADDTLNLGMIKK